MKILATLAALAAVTILFPMTPVQATDSIKEFQFYCSQCHGLEGKGDGPNVTKEFPVSPRNFTNSAEMSKLSDADLKNVILDGWFFKDVCHLYFFSLHLQRIFLYLL